METLGRISHLITDVSEQHGGEVHYSAHHAHVLWLSLTLLTTTCLLIFSKCDPATWTDAFKFHFHAAAGAAAIYLVATIPLFARGEADLHYLLEAGWALSCFSPMLNLRFSFTLLWISCSLITAWIAVGARGCAGLICPTLIATFLGAICCVSACSREHSTRSYYLSIRNSEFFTDNFRSILSNLMPPVAVEHLLNARKGEGGEFGSFFPFASVLFVGIKLQDGPSTSTELLADINEIFAKLDAVVDEHPSAVKIKTVCGVYIVAAGIPEASTDHTEILSLLALKMQAKASRHLWSTGRKLRIRFGIHSGPLCAGRFCSCVRAPVSLCPWWFLGVYLGLMCLCRCVLPPLCDKG